MSVMTKEDPKKAMAPQQKQEIAGVEATRPGRVFAPTVDILESDTEITLLADMPGVRADGLTIDLRDNVLSIDGRVERVGSDNERLLLREYDTGSFHREFRLTNLIDQTKIDASLRDGVLRLTLPKADAAKPRRIEVHVG